MRDARARGQPLFFVVALFAGFFAGAFAIFGALFFTVFVFALVVFFAAIQTSRAVFYHDSCTLQVIA